MILNFFLLFFTAVIAGSLVLIFPKYKERYFRLVLVFAGSYLFSITVIHLLPELFTSGYSASEMGLWILLGFLLQQLLEFLSSGIEHGHIHMHGKSSGAVFTVMFGLCIHAFLEGTLLSHGELMDHEDMVGHVHDSKTVLVGILMHKAPAAFALAAVLSSALSRKVAAILLVVFALASPLGMLSSSYLFELGMIKKEWIGILYGLVAGGFLHISTTIFFESSPQHKVQWNKLFVSFMAAALAVVSEFFF
ncbi:ZIP family metal transporter [Algoriphagus sediminis]|uniref:ZIP family metal transporter n=1 Tax=Algoriphagus sediminis TaxID=3057113 RepID=A0ABT7YCX2_9BACT|nr:ZIP family metal transporter [Algoriphagus sediminis]MDN3204328.1 ZIP family metal transporter [Algoriphagus sediminis]